jgi:ABC-type lipoprotein release transport system permease subunit
MPAVPIIFVSLSSTTAHDVFVLPLSAISFMVAKVVKRFVLTAQRLKKVEFEGKDIKLPFLQNKAVKSSEYVYSEGTAPMLENEIALSKLSADKLGVGVGDTVTVTCGEKTGEFIVTALLQSMDNLGLSGRFNDAYEAADDQI